MDKLVCFYWLDYYSNKWGVPDVIISGGCSGVDKLAEEWARLHGIPTRIFYPDAFLGKRGFLERNTLIANECTHCVAFPSKTSKGTWDTIRKVKSLNKPVKIKNID